MANSNYTLRLTQPYIQLQDFENDGWRQQFPEEIRRTIRRSMSAMIKRSCMSRYSLSLRYLNVEDYVEICEKQLFSSSLSEREYIKKLLYGLSRLMGINNPVYVVPEEEDGNPTCQFPHFPELNHTPTPYNTPHDDVDQLNFTRNDQFHDLYNWIKSINQLGQQNLLKEREILVRKREMDDVMSQINHQIADERREYLYGRYLELKKIKHSLRDIDELLNSAIDEHTSLDLDEFLKAVLLEKSSKMALPVPLSVGSGHVHYNLYNEVIAVTDAWAPYKLKIVGMSVKPMMPMPLPPQVPARLVNLPPPAIPLPLHPPVDGNQDLAASSRGQYTPLYGGSVWKYTEEDEPPES